jgi:hypothetical protein
MKFIHTFSGLSSIALLVAFGAMPRSTQSSPAKEFMVWKWTVGQERKYRIDFEIVRRMGFEGMPEMVPYAQSRGHQVWRIKALHFSADGKWDVSLTCDSRKIAYTVDHHGPSPMVEYDSNAPGPKPTDPTMREMAELVGKTFTAQIDKLGHLTSNDIPKDYGDSPTAENVLGGMNANNRIVVTSLDAVFSRFLPSNVTNMQDGWSAVWNHTKPGIGMLEFRQKYTLSSDSPRNPDQTRIQELITIVLTEPESKPGQKDVPLKDDPFLLHQRVRTYGGEAKGVILFNVRAGHLMKRTQMYREEGSTTNGGKEDKTVKTTVELITS